MGDLSEHFSRREFACKCRRCGCDKPDQALVDALEELRALAGNPIRINSALRCRRWNAHVGGQQDSQHVLGRAADIRIADLDPVDVMRLAEQVPAFEAGGIGLYPQGGANGNGFVHVDVRVGKRARWGRLGNGRMVSLQEAVAHCGSGD